ncbi:membrane protein [Gallibacterium genomosp. 3]|uniref:Membrane protein n=1 Tax=Gallibacterium genomosp. 3 TaxID=505345 RepID=A0A1A7NQU6_9PAST|nr:porin [Gallibacterium genomosp. 3]OBW91384.1 membrane protein [Gallibacterium genomosp. 3]
MKKTLVALAVAALAATSANAAVVYNQDGSKVEVGGSFRVLLNKNSDQRADLRNVGSRVIIKGTQDLGDGYSALANLEMRFDGNGKEEFNSIEAKRVFAGFAKDGVGTLTFGNQLTNLDDVAVSDYTYDLGGIKQTATSGSKVVKFRSADFSGFSFGLDYIFGQEDKDQYNADSGFGVSAFYTAALAADTKLNLEAGYSQLKKGTNAANYKVNAFLVGAELVSGPFSIGVDYSQKKATDNVGAFNYRDLYVNSDGDVKRVTTSGDQPAASTGYNKAIAANKVRELEVGVKYNYLENASIYGEYINGKATDPVGESIKMNAYILGTDYWFTKQVVSYLEAGTYRFKDDGDNKFNDNRIGVGFRVYF